MKVIFKNSALVSHTHLKNCVSTDDLRPAMCGVNINLKEKRLEATDAHILMTYPIEILEESVFDKELDSLIVPVRFFNRLKYMIDVPLNLFGTLEYVLTDEFAEVYFGNELVYRCKYIEEKFPKIESVLPNANWEKEVVDVIGFNCNVLDRAIKSVPSKFPNHIKLHLYGKNKGVFIESSNDDSPKVFGLIMPILI